MAYIVYSKAKEMPMQFHICTPMTRNKDVYRYAVKITEVWV